MSSEESAGRVAAEARARALIDRQLTEAGWTVQDKKMMNLFAAQGVAVREVTLKPGHGRADYLLYVDQRVVGVIEAKPEGTPLSGVEWQSSKYAEGLPEAPKYGACSVVPPAGFEPAPPPPEGGALSPELRGPGARGHRPGRANPTKTTAPG